MEILFKAYSQLKERGGSKSVNFTILDLVAVADKNIGYIGAYKAHSFQIILYYVFPTFTIQTTIQLDMVSSIEDI